MGALVLLLVTFLFAGGIRVSTHNFIGLILRQVAVGFDDPESKWMSFLCLGIYFTVFLFLRSRAVPGFWRVVNPSLWLAWVLIVSTISCFFNYSPSPEALTLFVGAVLGQGVAVWACFEARSEKPEVRMGLGILIPSLLVIMLVLASVWNMNSGQNFEYHRYARWSGPWDNPNIAGLLMGAGFALAAGSAVFSFQFLIFSHLKAVGWRANIKKYTTAILYFFAAIFMARGLFHSYSRGAWLATCLGLAYLAGHRFWVLGSAGCEEQPISKSEISCDPCVSWFNKNWLSLSAILLSVVILSFWHFRQAEWHPGHRAFSVGNQNDFSWRNRVAAWEGALRIMAENPWFGTGWNQPESMYEHYYLPSKLTDVGAIQLNDYFMLGATLGIPVLFCFGMYLWLSLFRNSAFSLQPLELLSATCRAGVVVLLVGFWFDGGLLKLATAATFWILMELGSLKLPQKGAKAEAFK